MAVHLRRIFRMRLLVVLALLAGFLVYDGSGAQVPQARAADPWTFQAGNIISDAVFFDASTMSAGDIQSFLNAKNPSCTSVAGWLPCLKDFRQDTSTRTADGICDRTYTGGVQESAATIVYKVAQACGINPRVLLVMLQKEQGLVQASGSSLNPANYPNRYRSAMGMGCPDTAACDSQYYGFFNQVYSAAHQMQRYATYPANYSYRAGRSNTILFSPRGASACGSSSVYIVNQATAGLYNYTPYQPNAAALNAGYGAGDACSAYGNRNFYLYFTDWFGTTGAYVTSGAIGGLWTGEGGGGGYLGYPVSQMFCGLVGDGCGQHFEGGSIYWTAGTGARAVSGAIRYAWSGQGWESGPLGYPTDRMYCDLPAGGCGQSFQHGQIAWTASTGARVLTDQTGKAWATVGGPGGALGYPTADAVCGLSRGGCRQDFQGGLVYTSPAGDAHALQGGIRAYWSTNGGETGWLGYPIGDLSCTADGCAQAFEGAWVAWTAANGNRVTNGGIAARWVAKGTAAIGYPTADMVCGLTGGGCRQDFQQGSIYWSASTGAWSVGGDIATAWNALQGVRSFLGYPTGEAACGLAQSGCRQQFQGGTVAWSAGTGAHALSGGIGSVWAGMGADKSSLGYPTSDMRCTTAGCSQQFQYGALGWTPDTGVHVIDGGINVLWVTQGGSSGPLGYPIANMQCGLADGGCRMKFQGGTIYWAPATGAHAVFGGIATVWSGMGADKSSLGYPSTDMECTTAGCSQQFQRGAIGWTPDTGVHVIDGGINALWVTQGGSSGPLGYPIANMQCGLADGGCRMKFQGGTIYWTPTTGAHAVSGAIAAAWSDAGGTGGSLGYPTGEPYPVADGVAQDFQGGRLTQNTTSGAVTRN